MATFTRLKSDGIGPISVLSSGHDWGTPRMYCVQDSYGETACDAASEGHSSPDYY